MDRWNEFELFVLIAELGSLSKAAEELELSNATASRLLVSLETRLAARLVERNTRGLSLTEAGEDFYRQCKGILADMKDAEAAANASTSNPSGLLRITGTLSSCMKFVMPVLPRFTQLYPKIEIELVTANRYADWIEHGIDVAIRTREFEPDSSITIRKLAETRRILAASPDYIRTFGAPASIEDLSRHKFLLYTGMAKPSELQLVRDGETRIVKVRGGLKANDGQLLRAAALDGLGILVQVSSLVHDDIAQGRLVPLLEDWQLRKLTINIAYRTRQHLPAKVRVFIDFMVDHFRHLNSLNKWAQ